MILLGPTMIMKESSLKADFDGSKLQNWLSYVWAMLKLFGAAWLQGMGWLIVFGGAVLLIERFAGFETTLGQVLLLLLIPLGLIVSLLMLVKFDSKFRAADEKRRSKSNESEI